MKYHNIRYIFFKCRATVCAFIVCSLTDVVLAGPLPALGQGQAPAGTNMEELLKGIPPNVNITTVTEQQQGEWLERQQSSDCH